MSIYLILKRTVQNYKRIHKQKSACLYTMIYTHAEGGDLVPSVSQRHPPSGAAPLLPLGPAGMFSVLALSPEPNQSKRLRDFCYTQERCLYK